MEVKNLLFAKESLPRDHAIHFQRQSVEVC